MLTFTDGFVVAVAVVIVREGRVLVMRRAPTKDAAPGLWETVSGRIEPDEQPLAAAVREVREESGLEVRVVPRPVDAYTIRRGSVPMVVLVYRADWVAGEVRRSDEHEAHVWCRPEELAERGMPERLVAAIARALQMG